MKSVTRCHENRDEIDHFGSPTVTVFVTSLSYHTYPAIRRQRAAGRRRP